MASKAAGNSTMAAITTTLLTTSSSPLPPITTKEPRPDIGELELIFQVEYSGKVVHVWFESVLVLTTYRKPYQTESELHLDMKNGGVPDV